MTQKRKPGDLILDRYYPTASAEERERAREVLRVFFGYLYRCRTSRVTTRAISKTDIK